MEKGQSSLISKLKDKDGPVETKKILVKNCSRLCAIHSGKEMFCEVLNGIFEYPPYDYELPKLTDLERVRTMSDEFAKLTLKAIEEMVGEERVSNFLS